MAIKSYRPRRDRREIQPLTLGAEIADVYVGTEAYRNVPEQIRIRLMQIVESDYYNEGGAVAVPFALPETEAPDPASVTVIDLSNDEPITVEGVFLSADGHLLIDIESNIEEAASITIPSFSAAFFRPGNIVFAGGFWTVPATY
jgi:hypothetical protein